MLSPVIQIIHLELPVINLNLNLIGDYLRRRPQACEHLSISLEADYRLIDVAKSSYREERASPILLTPKANELIDGCRYSEARAADDRA